MKITKEQLKQIIKEELNTINIREEEETLNHPATQAVMSALEQLLKVAQETGGQGRPDSARLRGYAVGMTEDILKVAKENLHRIEYYMPSVD